MAKKTTVKILQTKLALSERAFRLGEPSRLSVLDAVAKINAMFVKPAERRAVSGEKAVECRASRPEGNVIGLHLVGYIPDDAVGVIPHNAENLTLQPPPPNSDYLDGELMALVAHDAIIVCRLGLFESSLNNYIEDLGPKAGLDREDASFLFKNRVDVDKLKMIEDDGVAQIRFNGVANEASVKHVTGASGPIRKFLDGVWEEVKALAYDDASKSADVENVKVEVFLKFDKRGGTEIDQAELKRIAEGVADEDDGFQIMTLSGRKITPTDVLLNKKVSLPRYGKSVAFNDVFDEMLTYYKELSEPGGA